MVSRFRKRLQDTIQKTNRMTMKKIYCCVFSLLMFVLAQSQSQPAKYRAVIGPSPNAASYDKYGEIPVSTYTGVPDIEVPIHTIVNADIKVPVTLSYHSSGIRVDEEASRAGLGWVLNAGGVINRRVKDKDDFWYQWGYQHVPLTEFFDSEATEYFKRTNSNISMGFYDQEPCKRSIVGRPMDFGHYMDDDYDMEPDIFTFNFLGMTGRFVLGKNGEVVKEKEDALKIQLMDTTGTKWQITAPDGMRYQFYKPEVTTYHRPGFTNYETYITTWYLTKIISPSGAEVTFNYVDQGPGDIQSLFTINQRDNLRSHTYEGPNSPGCGVSGLVSTNPPGQSFTLTLLESITYRHGSLSFEYDSRIDINGDKRLSRIRINNSSNPAHSTSVELLHDYFTANSGGNVVPPPNLNYDLNLFNKRLKLLGVRHLDAGGKVVSNHAFTYNETTLPPKNSYARDYWGYFNGQLGNSKMIPSLYFVEPFVGGVTISKYDGGNREPHPQHAQAYLLKSIQYPTGGKSTIDYEPNDYDPGNSVNTNSQTRVNNITKDSAIFDTRRITTVVDETFTFTVPAHAFAGTKVDFVIDSRSGETQTETTYAGDMYVEIYNSSNVRVRRYDLGLRSSWSTSTMYELYVSSAFDLAPDTYTVKTHVAPNVKFLQFIRLNFSWHEEKNHVGNHTITQGGGNRVLRVTSQESPTSNRIIKKYVYSYMADANGNGVKEKYSSGKRLTEQRYTSFEAVPTCFAPFPKMCYEFILSSENHIASNGAPVGYDSVWVLNGEAGEGGMTRFDYENVPGLTVPYGQPDVRPAGIEDMLNPGNGRLKQKTEYRFAGAATPFQKARETIMTYHESPVKTLVGIRRGLGTMVGWRSFDGNHDCGEFECNAILYQYPAFQSSWSVPASETVRDYAGSAYVETKKTYQYEQSPVHYNPIKITETTSGDKQKHAFFTYATDYAAGSGFIDSLKAYHIVNVPIESVNCLEDTSGVITVTKGVITKFQANGKALPLSVMGLENSRPIDLASFKFSNRPKGVLPTTGTPGVFLPDVQYKSQMSYDRYDAANNLVQQTRVNDISKSYLWSHTNYPVAEATNAKWNEIYFESFDDAAVSGVVKDSVRSHSGKYGGKIDKATAGAANVQGRTLTVAFTTPAKFTYSGWVYSAGPAAKIFLVMKRTGETAPYTYIDSITTTATNEWVFVNKEFNVPQDVIRINLQLTNTGGGTVWFDDLRLHPSAARMTTYTYTPLVGMTSQSDADNQVVNYYEYDGVGRLIHVRDRNRNILRKIHYAYKRPGDGCTN
jgi:hypothetical protein